jgi:hypothetical protein
MVRFGRKLFSGTAFQRQRKVVQDRKLLSMGIVELRGFLLRVQAIKVAENSSKPCTVGRYLFRSPKWFLPNWPVA